MKMGKAVFKAGKLLKVFVEFDELIHRIKITGDFFFYPEEAIAELERALEGTPVNEEEIRRRVEAFLQRPGIEAYGFDAAQLTQAIMAACR
ncbi:MAG: lipoate protein ligase C-terminal domain-containing protein [Candidatus Micrarchaeia archaeon]